MLSRALGATVVAAACAVPATAAAVVPSCRTQHWIGAWAASPTDSGRGTTTLDRVIAGLRPSPEVNDTTVRAVLTPTHGGKRVRVRLSNRFGPAALTFRHVTVARQKGRAAIVSRTLRKVRFDGRRTVRVAAGRDVVSDPVRLSFRAFQTLAVSVHVPGDAGKGTRHAVARQTSYVAPAGTGDATSERSGASFTQATTTRPFVTGIEVRAPRSAGAVVALGDSLTDGAQNEANGVTESTEGLDEDVRYPDWLARRLRSAGRPLSVLNAGISGNKVLRDGAFGDNLTLFGPSALERLRTDVLRQRGVTTVILWLGINDLSQTPRATPAELIAGYERLIARLQRADLRVLQATLTPFKGFPPTAGSGEDQQETSRLAVNRWIRSHSTADAVVDFDRAIRDPDDPRRLAPRYDDGEHLHLTAAGYRRVARVVPLRALASPPCARLG